MTPLLLLPGLVCDRALWEPLLPVLCQVADCRIADYGELASIPAMAERVLASAPPRFALAGHSMGGRVALEIMRLAADRVERLAVFDSGFQPRPGGAAGELERDQRHALVALAAREGMRAMGLEWLKGMLHPARLADRLLTDAIADMVARHAPQVFAAHDMVARHAPQVFAAQIEALLARPDATDVLRGIRCPTLLGCGRQDVWSPLARHVEMAGLVAGASLAVIEESGHMAPMERPAQCATKLVAWIKGDSVATV